MLHDHTDDQQSDLGDGRSRFTICPSTEPVLLADGRLLLVPTRDRQQLQVDAPWGRMVHEVLVRGRPVASVVAPADREVFDATIRYLAASRVVLPASLVSAADVARYDRQVRWFAQEGLDGPQAQRRLAASTVLVIGVGGMGSATAELLARSGVGRLVLVDHDRVEEVNLSRQLLYDEQDVGARKAFAAAAHLEQIVQGIEVHAIDRRIHSRGDVERVVRRFRPDLIVCAADVPYYDIRTWVGDAAFANGLPVLYGGSRAPFAYVGPLLVPGQTSCFACFHASATERGAEELEAEVRAVRAADPPNLPAVGWCDVATACFAAAQGIGCLTGAHRVAVLGRTLELDLRACESRWEAQPGAIRAGCSTCSMSGAA